MHRGVNTGNGGPLGMSALVARCGLLDYIVKTVWTTNWLHHHLEPLSRLLCDDPPSGKSSILVSRAVQLRRPGFASILHHALSASLRKEGSKKAQIRNVGSASSRCANSMRSCVCLRGCQMSIRPYKAHVLARLTGKHDRVECANLFPIMSSRGR